VTRIQRFRARRRLIARLPLHKERRRIREAAGISLRMAEERLEISRQLLSQWETVSNPRVGLVADTYHAWLEKLKAEERRPYS